MKLFHADRPAVAIRGVHLDLKGLPPTPRRFIEILDLIAAARFNCVLVEWEDTYPWARYPELRCQTAYSRTTVGAFLKRAAELRIQVVPLVQSFGHVENVLGKQRFRALREHPDAPGELCPCHPRAQATIRQLIEDVLETHEGRITHFHLGGDEVWSLGSCPKCRRAERKGGKAALYIRHIVPLLLHLKTRGIQPILWDDMMRPWPMARLRALAHLTDLMPWTYGARPFEWLKPETLERFRRAGIALWGAGAFKGAEGPHVDVCDMQQRSANMLAWAAAARRHRLAGVVATGWSRYNTFRVPCESLEASLDALVLAGAALWDGALPPDALAQADAFLLQGPAKALAGPRFLRCRDAARCLHDWWKTLPRHLNEARSQAFLAGETERLDALALKRLRHGWREYLAQGAACARDWRQAHAGLVPRVWLDRYVASRLWLPRALDLCP